MTKVIIAAGVVALLIGSAVFFFFFNKPDEDRAATTAKPEAPVMSFFVTSTNPGSGGDFGGLKGADAYCARLAESVGVTGRTWRAYLSAPATQDHPVVHARDRIGPGPWYNAKGELIASNVQQLHTDNFISKATAFSEKGEVISGRGDAENMHDILTGSTANGELAISGSDTTCQAWTSSDSGSAIVGHHDRLGPSDDAPMPSWNSSHSTRGCSMSAFKSTGGAGLLYCFAK